MIDSVTVKELATKLANQDDIFILDVRNPDEYAQFNIGGYLCPLPELMQRLDELPRDKLIVVHCRSGHRSQTAALWLMQAGFTQVQNLIGGMLAWQQESLVV